mmetsp:Transcript_37716/g.116538  ORF Transcript_37716/g.116538 Transcript_37716/m.116538 type:complete len:226 (-) Transcript_37716:1062-1739(-)
MLARGDQRQKAKEREGKAPVAATTGVPMAQGHRRQVRGVSETAKRCCTRRSSVVFTDRRAKRPRLLLFVTQAWNMAQRVRACERASALTAGVRSTRAPTGRRARTSAERIAAAERTPRSGPGTPPAARPTGRASRRRGAGTASPAGTRTKAAQAAQRAELAWRRAAGEGRSLPSGVGPPVALGCRRCDAMARSGAAPRARCLRRAQRSGWRGTTGLEGTLVGTGT